MLNERFEKLDYLSLRKDLNVYICINLLNLGGVLFEICSKYKFWMFVGFVMEGKKKKKGFI